MSPQQKMAHETSLSERISFIIKKSGVKQADFARSLGISANYVYMLTSGRKKSISEPLAKLIESIYGYSSEWVLTGWAAKKPPAHPQLLKKTWGKIRDMHAEDLSALWEYICMLEAIREI